MTEKPALSGRETRDKAALLPGKDGFSAGDLSEKLFAHAAVGLAITDLDDRFLEVNEAFCSLTGYSEAELQQTSFLEIIQPEDRSDTRQRIRSLLAGKTSSFVVERRLIRKDGRLVWVQNSVSLVHDHDGRPTHFARLIEEINERKHAERAIKIAPTIVLAGLGTLAALTTLGLLEHFFERVVSEALALCVPVIFGSIAAAGITYFALRRQEALYRRTLEEITKRERAEIERREAERKYRDIFENAVEGIFQTTPDGEFITANPALARMLGFETPEELIRARTDIEGSHYVHPERRVEFKRLLDQHGIVRGFEFEAYRKDGTRVWMSDNVRAVRDASGKLLYYEGTVEDITERQRAEAHSAAFAALARKLSGARTSLDAGRIIAATATDLFGWDSCNLDLYDADRDLVYPMLNVDTIDGRQVDVTSFILERKPTPRSRSVIDHGPQLILRKEPVRFEEDAVPFGDHTRPSASIMSVPICHASKVIGLLSIQSYTPLAYDHTTLKDLQALADHCGEALNRIRAEEELRNTEERYRDLVENSHELICTHDLDGLVLSANPAAAAAVGYDLDEYVGKKTIRDLLAPEVRHQFDEYMARLYKDGATSGIMLVQTMSGERRVWQYYNSLRTEGVAAPIVRGMARDITEQRRAEKAMSDLRRELELTMNSMEEGIHRVDLQGKIVFENPAAARMLGWEVAELLGKPGHPTIHHTRQDGTPYPQEECPIYATFRDGVPRHVADEVFWRQDGTNFPVEYMTAPMRDDRNEIVATVVTFRDITKRKRAEKVLRASERRYRDIFTFAPVGIYQSVRDGTLITANKALAEMLAYDSVDEFLKVNLADVYFAPDEREKLIREYEDRGFAADLEIQWRRKDGAPIWVQLSAHAIKGANGATEYFEGFVRNISDRKLTEAALRDSEERYRELFENAKDAIYVHDLRGEFTSVNRAAERLYGYAREEILGKHFWDFVAPEYVRYFRENVCNKLEETGETNYEVEIVTRGGARVPVEVSSRQIYENGVVVGVQGSARDITERKRARQALLTYSRRLIAAQEAERRRIARELHDQIGQMLTALKLNLHAIQSMGDAHEARPLIEDNLKLLDEALEQVRDLSVDLRPLLLDDLGLVTALRWYVDHQPRTGVPAEFIFDSIDPDLRFSSELETACFRIAQEALTNVARHAQAKLVTVRLSRDGPDLVLLIKDDGVGFDVEALQRHSVADATLGMQGMEERAQAAGGRIRIDSTIGKGTEVMVRLPVAIPNQAETKTQTTKRPRL